MYQTPHNIINSSDSESSVEDFPLKDSDEETTAWIAEVSAWQRRVYNNLDDTSSESEDERKKNGNIPNSLLIPAKFLFDGTRVSDKKPIGNDPQSSKGQSVSGLKRKHDGDEMSEVDEVIGMEEAAGPSTDPNGTTVPKDEDILDGEVLALKVDCHLFVYSTVISSWIEKAGGVLHVYDEGESPVINSRFTIRSQKKMRLLLSSQIWSGMTIVKQNQTSIRITTLDPFGQVKVYLLSFEPEQLDEVYDILWKRIEDARKMCSKNYLTRFEIHTTASKKRAAAASKDDDYIDPAELD